ncbi:MAG: cytochrome B, partial [Burkholderiales bacterium PBB5]
MERQAVRVWDLPTRVFHWALALAVLALVVTGHVGGNALVWHLRLGLLVLALLLFRAAWGVVGGRWSRFASFVRGPAALRRYLRGQG